MSLVEGGAPLQEAAVAQQLTWAEAQGVARQAFAHLRALHIRRIAHQDLRADNVLLDGNGRVRLHVFERPAAHAGCQAGHGCWAGLLQGVHQHTSISACAVPWRADAAVGLLCALVQVVLVDLEYAGKGPQHV